MMWLNTGFLAAFKKELQSLTSKSLDHVCVALQYATVLHNYTPIRDSKAGDSRTLHVQCGCISAKCTQESKSVLFYLGLAILGRGGFAAFFSHPALVALALCVLAMSAVALFSRGNIGSGEREDRSNRWVIAAFGAIGLADAYLPAYTDRVGLWIIGGEAMRWLGVAIFAAGGALRLWPVFVLGNRFSGLVAIQPGHTLVTGGIYRVIRNPSYVGMLVGTLGWGLAFRAGVGVLLAALIVAPLIARIRAEERLLRAQFGAEYDAYCARTWRLIPWVY